LSCTRLTRFFFSCLLHFVCPSTLLFSHTRSHHPPARPSDRSILRAFLVEEQKIVKAVQKERDVQEAAEAAKAKVAAKAKPVAKKAAKPAAKKAVAGKAAAKK
jgi:hypothetical protein